MKSSFTQTIADCIHAIFSQARHARQVYLKTVVVIMAFFAVFVTNVGAQSALHFDGVSSYVSINSPFRNFDKEITVEFWMNPATANLPFGSVIGQGTSNVDNWATANVWLMHPNNNGTMTFYVSDAGTLKTAICNILPNAWHHYAAVSNATSTKFYVDGVLIPQGTGYGAGISTKILNNSNSVVHIGKDVRFDYGDYDIPRFANMSIDEVRIWDRALCQDEIVKTMNCEVNAQPGLQELYHFNQSSGTTLTDASSFGRDGVLTHYGTSGTPPTWVVSCCNHQYHNRCGYQCRPRKLNNFI